MKSGTPDHVSILGEYIMHLQNAKGLRSFQVWLYNEAACAIEHL